MCEILKLFEIMSINVDKLKHEREFQDPLIVEKVKRNLIYTVLELTLKRQSRCFNYMFYIFFLNLKRQGRIFLCHWFDKILRLVYGNESAF